MRPTDADIAHRLTSTLGSWDQQRLEEYARKFSAADREKLAKEGKALSDGSYPIPDESSLRDAETLAKSGHGDVSGATALIKKRAKELGVKHEMGAKEKAADSHDAAVRKAIESAIDLQRKDPDINTHEADRRVLALLHSALEAQIQDEATDKPAKSSGNLY